MGSSEWAQLQRSPFKQVADQRYTLQRYLSNHFGIDSKSFAHAVAFPGCDITDDLGPDSPRELAIDATDLRDPTTALHRVRKHWGECPRIADTLIDSIIAKLRPSFEMTILSSSVAATTAEMLERETRRQVHMVESQIQAYRTLLSTDRVVALGGAGTGKTVIAAQLAMQLASTGSRTLLLCHRVGVQSFLSTLLGIRPSNRSYDGSSADFPHVAAWVKVAGAVASHVGRASVRNSDPNLGEHFFEFRDALSAPYDAIVVDEGQEFTKNQIEALSWLLDDPDYSPMYIFADPFQHSGIFSTTPRDRIEKRISYRWAPPIIAETVGLMTNCRNSKQIADLASRFYPQAAPTPLVDGLAPQFHQVTPRELLPETFRLISELINQERFQPNQLLVVPIDFAHDDVRQAAQHSGVPIVSVKDVFRFPLTPKDLRVAFGSPDDVQGLEADVTVVAYAQGATNAGTLREMYIATSRARTVLHVVSHLSPDQIVAAEAMSAGELGSDPAASASRES